MPTTSERRAAFVAGLAALLTMSCHAAPYQIDSNETKATFETRFLGIVPVRGSFKRTTGALDYDVTTRQGTIRAAIQAATLEAAGHNGESTGRMLRGPEFFDVEKYPTIDFVSSKFQWEENKLVAIEGTLTIRGVVKPATLSISRSQCVAAIGEKKSRCEASAQFTVKRSEFGMTGWSATVSDEVKISVEFVATLEAAPEPAAPVPVTPPAK